MRKSLDIARVGDEPCLARSIDDPNSGVLVGNHDRSQPLSISEFYLNNGTNLINVNQAITHPGHPRRHLRTYS
jgi:hypothetical protein